MKSVLITGGGGFLGSHLASRFLREGYSLILVDNFCTGLRSNKEIFSQFKDQVQFLEKDVISPWSSWLSEVSADRLRGLKYIFHFASPASPPVYQKLNIETMWVNSLGLENCIQLADQYSAKVVFASTSEIYGDPAISPQPEEYWGNVNSMGPRSCYDEAKRFGEALIYSYNQRNKTRHGLVRIFNTYGPRMNPNDGRVIINLLVQGLQGHDLTVYGDGQQTRSFCYVDDLIAGISQYAEKDLLGPVNIGNPGEFTILELAKTVQKIFSEKKLKIVHLPLPADDPKRRCPDITKAKELLSPWQPKVSLDEGLSRMLEWLAKEPAMRNN